MHRSEPTKSKLTFKNRVERGVVRTAGLIEGQRRGVGEDANAGGRDARATRDQGG